MPNKQQIKLIQTAVRAAGFRTAKSDGRYRFLLGQYLSPNGNPVTSCKQLTNDQIDDLLAICEAHGWRYPGKGDYYCRRRVERKGTVASFAQQHALQMLAGDLGWQDYQLAGMIRRMTDGRADHPASLTPGDAHIIIEAMKIIFGRSAGKTYPNLKAVQQDQEAATDGEKQTG